MKRILIIFVIVLTVMSCGNDYSVEHSYLSVTIDSISKHERYTVIPSDYYHYHTSIGAIPTNNLKNKVGDTIKVKIIKYKYD